MTVEEIVEDQHDMETGVGLMTKSFFLGLAVVVLGVVFQDHPYMPSAF